MTVFLPYTIIHLLTDAGSRVFAAHTSGAAEHVRLLVLEPLLEERPPPGDSPPPPAAAVGWGTSLSLALSLGTGSEPMSDAAEAGEATTRLVGWRLTGLLPRTPAQMQACLVRESRWEAALQLGAAVGLSKEPVLQARFRAQPLSVASLRANLDGLSDRRWAVEAAMERAADTAAEQREVLRWLLEETGAHCARGTGRPDVEVAGTAAAGPDGSADAASHSGDSSEAGADRLWWLSARLSVLRHLDRLETLCAMHDGCGRTHMMCWAEGWDR